MHDPNKTLALNDDDIIRLINSQLPANQQIDLAAFTQYRDAERYGDEPLQCDYTLLSEKLNALHIQQKLLLLEKLQTAGAGWNKWRWLLEVKFPEFVPRRGARRYSVPKPIKFTSA